MNEPLNIPRGRRRYDALIGTGGIGSGAFFALKGRHTLGREESRGGRFLDRRDYCKLHIVAHYAAVLMGKGFAVRPVGRVGDDETGRRLLKEMRRAGMDLRHVETAVGEQTMYSICLIYPDGSGGNLTVDDSACSRVTAGFVSRCEGDFAEFGGRGIALAAPEVPLTARARLLAVAGRHGFFRAASFVSGELTEAREIGMLADTDLLALNADEAAALAGVSPGGEPADIAKAAVGALCKGEGKKLVSVTAGRAGSWAWDGERMTHYPAVEVPVVSTAGAGDAHLSGLLVGLSAALSFDDACRLASLVAALSVTGPHTINDRIDRRSLRALAASGELELSPELTQLLGG